MKKILILLVCIAAAAQGQEFAFEYWHEGKVVTEEGDTLRGTIQYNLQSDLIQLKRGSLLDTYTARKVLFFEIFDITVKQYRQFFSLPFAVSGNQYKAPVFFELLAEGKLTVLSREALEYRTYSAFNYYGTYTRLVLVNKYYLLDERGAIIEFKGNKNDWLYMMGNKGSDVQRFAKTNKLDFDDKYDLVKIVSYYNSLFAKG
jgi:hypothetical protein